MKKERPILMRTHDVQALIASRKTQSRIVVNTGRFPQTEFDLTPTNAGLYRTDKRGQVFNTLSGKPAKSMQDKIISPPYKPGDILWVREKLTSTALGGAIYAADNSCVLVHGERPAVGYWDWDEFSTTRGTIPSIHMPKSAARIWLEVESVRVERLQDISDKDAVAEGVERVRAKVDELANVIVGTEVYRNYPHPLISGLMHPRDSYRTLWQSIHGPESWNSNPCVWVINYRILSTTGKP